MGSILQHSWCPWKHALRRRVQAHSVETLILKIHTRAENRGALGPIEYRARCRAAQRRDLAPDLHRGPAQRTAAAAKPVRLAVAVARRVGKQHERRGDRRAQDLQWEGQLLQPATFLLLPCSTQILKTPSASHDNAF